MHRVHLLVGKCVYLGNERYVGVHPHPKKTPPPPPTLLLLPPSHKTLSIHRFLISHNPPGMLPPFPGGYLPRGACVTGQAGSWPLAMYAPQDKGMRRCTSENRVPPSQRSTDPGRAARIM